MKAADRCLLQGRTGNKIRSVTAFFFSHRWISALVINLITAILMMLLGSMAFETNDDFSIGIQIADGNYCVGFVNYYLCIFLHFVQTLLPSVNTFVLMQILSSFAGLTVLTYVILDQPRSPWITIPLLPILVIVGVDHYLYIQFTKTAALLLAAGTMLILHTVLNHRGGIRPMPVICIMIGTAMILLGSMWRYGAILAVIGFAGVFASAHLLDRWSAMRQASSAAWLPRERSFRYLFLRIISFGLIILLVSSMALAIHKASTAANHATPALRAYREYNRYRSDVVDHKLPDYEEYTEFYQSLGLSSNDHLALRTGFYDTDRIASLSKLKAIDTLAEGAQKRTTLRAVLASGKRLLVFSAKKLNKRFFHIILCLLLGIAALLLVQKRWMLYPLFLAIGAMAAYGYLLYEGRTVYRGTYIIDLFALFMLLYAGRYADPKQSLAAAICKDSARRIKKTAAAMTLAATILFIALIPHWSPQQRLTSCDSDALFDYMKKCADIAFVMDSSTSIHAYRCNLSYYNNPLKRQPALNNLLSFGGWSTFSPNRAAKLRANGLSNVYQDIIDNDRVLVVSNSFSDKYGKNAISDVISTYFTEHYAPDGAVIEFQPVQTIGGLHLWKAVTIH